MDAHWGYDLGAAWLTEALGALGGAWAVLSTVSRLLMDVNRDPTDSAAVLVTTDDGSPSFNRHVDLGARIERFHAPFHATVDAALREHRPAWICSVHSFTPVFRGYARSMAAGVLFDRFDEDAARLAAAMTAEGLPTVLNEPYSGKAGLIYSAKRHGDAHDIPYLELEVRQDLLASPEQAAVVAGRIWRAWVRAGM